MGIMNKINNFLISIIIPVYNVDKYLDNTLKSIEEQTIGLNNLEVILVDDGSNDGSQEIIKRYLNKYDNFKGIFCQVSSGFPGKPRNIGLEICSSDFVMFLDSDDYLEKDACEILYNKIIETGSDIVSGSYTSLDSNLKEEMDLAVWITTLTDPMDNYNNRKEYVKKLLSNSRFELIVNDLKEYPSIIANYNVWGKIFKKSLFDSFNIKFPEDRVAQDSVFLLECIYNANKIVFIKDIIVHYNNQRNDSNDSSISHIKNKKNVEGRLSAYFLMYNISKKHNYTDLFAKYILSQKLNYWFKYHLLNVDMDESFLLDILYNYQSLFKLCYYNNSRLSYEISSIFKDISENNFDKSIEKIKILALK